MADKKQIKSHIKNLKKVRTWQLLIFLVLSIFLTATFLRLNNIGMIHRYEAVIESDKNGDEQQLKSRLYDLSNYIAKHMNASSGQFQLRGQYERAVKRISDEVGKENANNPNGNIYKKASDACDPHYTLYSNPYFQCIVRELEKYPSSENVKVESRMPKAGAFLYNYASPVWSPDIAGFSVLVTIIIAITIILRVIGVLVFNFMLYKKYKTI